MASTPQLRFPEFTDEWKIERLGQIVSFHRGGALSKDQLDNNGRYKAIHYGELFTKYNEVIKEARSKTNTNTGKISESGDLLMPTSDVTPEGLAKASAIYESGVMLGGDINVLRPNRLIDSTYLSYLINSQKKKVMRLVTGTTVRHVYASDIAKIYYGYPSLDEQQKIAYFLTAVDDKISALEQKAEKLETYKRGVMQKIFARRIRFTRYDGSQYPDWVERRAGELFSNISNRKHNGDLPLLAITQDQGVVARGRLDRKIKQSVSSISSYKVIEPKDFVISLRSFQGGIEMSDVIGISSPAYTVLKGSSEVFPEMFKHYFKRDEFISKLNSTVIGIRDGKQISYGPFSTIKLPAPSVDEQQKIADFLSSIDRKITLTSKQLDKTKEFKKGLLQRMFV